MSYAPQNEFEKVKYQCQILPDGEPFLYPNEEIYNRTNGVAFLDEEKALKVYDGIAMVTTHRVIYVKGFYGVEIPHHYIKKQSQEGGMFTNPRVEIFLDKS